MILEKYKTISFTSIAIVSIISISDLLLVIVLARESFYLLIVTERKADQVFKVLVFMTIYIYNFDVSLISVFNLCIRKINSKMRYEFQLIWNENFCLVNYRSFLYDFENQKISIFFKINIKTLKNIEPV